MDKREVIDILNNLSEKIQRAGYSYDDNADIEAIRVAIDCIESCIAIEGWMKLMKGNKEN